MEERLQSVMLSHDSGVCEAHGTSTVITAPGYGLTLSVVL
jgi:hypothetical protein